MPLQHHSLMFTGTDLGKAIKSAIHKKIASGGASSKKEIAAHFGVTPPAIHTWINSGAISKDKLPELWRYFSDVVSPEHWGITEYPFQKNTTLPHPGFEPNTEPGPRIRGLIPLISWVQAGAFCTSPDLLQPGDAEEWLPAIKKHGPHTYALRIKGDSMVSPYPGQRTYPPGTIIFVDPDVAVTNGCRVIARIHDSDEATFKVYSEDSGKRYLKPLNPQYPTLEMTGTMHLCGVIVGSWSEE